MRSVGGRRGKALAAPTLRRGHWPVLLPHYTGFAPQLKLWVGSPYKNARIFMTVVPILSLVPRAKFDLVRSDAPRTLEASGQAQLSRQIINSHVR